MGVDRSRLGPGEQRVSADLVAQRGFATGFRGFDQAEVRAFLGQVADELRRLRDHTVALERALHAAEEQAAHPRLDEDTLMTALGEETASIVRTAKAAAADIKAQAEDNAARVLREAHARSEAVRSEADEVLAKRIDEAERAVAGVREVAEATAERVRVEAAETARQVLDQSKHEAKMVLDTAHATRDQMLGDLSRKRKLAMVQIEQLRAGRDRLLDAYRTVRRTLDEVTTELQRADAEARAAAEAAGRRAVRSDAGLDKALPPEQVPELASPAEHAAPAEQGMVAGQGWGRVSSPDDPLAPAPSGPEEPTADLEAVAPEATSPPPEAAMPAEPLPPAVPAEAGGAPGPRSSDVAAALGQTGNKVAADEVAGDEATGGGLSIVEAPSALESVRVIAPAPGPQDQSVDLGSGHEPAIAAVAGAAADPSSVEPAADVQPAEAASPTDPATVTNADESLLQRRDKAINPIEADLARRLKRVLQDEQNDLLDRLRNIRGTPTAAEVLPDRQAHAVRFRDAGRPLLERAARAGSEFAALSLDASSPSPRPGSGAKADVDDLAAGLAEAIVDPLRRRLEQAILGDDDPVVLAESLGAAYREWKTQRIEQTAADQVAGAFARGQFAATPAGTRLRWIVDDVDGPCPDCDDNALAGDLGKAELWPTGQQHPPAHVGCRCLVVPAGPQGPSRV
jgi:DivIVA domain-containing protein